MRTTIHMGTISSFLILVFSLLFLVLILSLGSNAPSGWGFVSAYESSSVAFNVFTYAVFVSLLVLPCWAVMIYSICRINTDQPLKKPVFIISLLSVFCLMVVYIIELTVVRSSITGINQESAIRDDLLRLDNIMFCFDNIGYFLYGLSSILIISLIDTDFRTIMLKISLISFGLASMTGLPGILFDNKTLMMINLIGMGLTYPLAGGMILHFFIKLKSKLRRNSYT
jgi:hypothetical protein